MPFKQMENVTAFIHACRSLGVLEMDVFSTVDLYEKKNMKAVVGCIYNLAGIVRTTAPTFSGPYLGVAKRASVTDVARTRQAVTQDMGYRKDIDAEVRAGVHKVRIAGDPTTAAPAVRPAARAPASPQGRPPSPRPVASSTPSPRARSDAVTTSRIRLSGPLLKLSPSFRGGWQLRWAEVSDGCVRYYASPNDANAGTEPIGVVELRGMKIHKKSGTFFEFAAANSGERVFSHDADTAKRVASAGWDIGPSAPPCMQDWVVALEHEAVFGRRA
jgi:hypothetical protein